MFVRGVTAAHDPVNDRYFVVGAQNHVIGVFVNNLGVPVTPQIVIKPFAPSEVPFGSFPRVCFSPHVNGGQGGFLVVWAHEGSSTTQLHTRLVSLSGTLLGTEAIVSDSNAWKDVAGAAIAYSPTSKVFLIAWKEGPVFVSGAWSKPKIRVQRVGITGALVGPSVAVSAGFGQDPGVAWNPNRDEFGVSFSGETGTEAAFSAFVRVPAGNPAGFARTTFNNLPGGKTFVTDIDFNTATDRFVMVWWESPGGGTAKVAEIDQDGNVVAMGVASFVIGSYDALSAAYNPVSGTFLLAGLDSVDNVRAAELNSRGVRISSETTISVSPPTQPARYTRVSTSSTSPRWIAHFTYYDGAPKRMLDQVVHTGTTGGGPTGSHPPPGTPPPPPPCTFSVSPPSVSNVVAGGASITLAVTAPVGCAWTASEGSTFLSITSGASGSGNGSVVVAVAANTSTLSRSAVVSIAGQNVTISQVGAPAPPPPGQPPPLPAYQWSIPATTTVADYNNDGRSDPTVFRPSNAWWIRLGLQTVAWGAFSLGDIPAPGDYDGDERADIAVYRTTTGKWYVQRSSGGPHIEQPWGSPADFDVPVPGDYDGDGKTDFAVYRRKTGEWRILRSSDGLPFSPWPSGTSQGEIPVQANYDGDTRTDAAVYRASTGQFVIRRSSTGLVVTTLPFGIVANQDIPVSADFDADGKADIAVFSNVTAWWRVSLTTTGGEVKFPFGNPALGDTPVPADYDGDKEADIAVFRRSTAEWYIFRSSTRTTWKFDLDSPGDIVRRQ